MNAGILPVPTTPISSERSAVWFVLKISERNLSPFQSPQLVGKDFVFYFGVSRIINGSLPRASYPFLA